MTMEKRNNGIVINTDKDAYTRHKMKREQIKKNKSLEYRVFRLEKELKELKKYIENS